MADKNASNEIQLVVFNLAQESYGVDISDVRDINRMQDITRVPGAPSFVEGVINLRGSIIPIVDLRKRLNLNVTEQTKDSRILVVDIDDRNVGLIVDEVSEVLRVPKDSVEPSSKMISKVDTDYLDGIVKLKDMLIILLNVSRVLSATEQTTLAEVTVAAAESKVIIEDDITVDTGGKQLAAV